jgi:C-terminal processing protease CtpA/Prc
MVLSPMHKSGTAQHQTTATHAFQKGSHSWLISYGFSINKSSEGAFVVTSLNSSDIRRFEVGDVIATVDGHVLLPEYALEDVARMLEEPPGTSAQVTLLRRSSGTSVVMRKSAQFLRMSNHHTMDSFDHHFDCHHAKTHNNSKELIKIDTTSETVWNNEANDEGHSENSVASASSLSQTFSSSSASNFSCLESGVGLAFHEQNSATEKCYVVDRILQLSPAHYCGQING